MLPRVVPKFCPGFRFAARIPGHGWGISFDRTHLSRTDDALRRAAFSRARIFIFRTAQTRRARRLAKFRAQQISGRAPSHLARMKFQSH